MQGGQLERAIKGLSSGFEVAELIRGHPLVSQLGDIRLVGIRERGSAQPEHEQKSAEPPSQPHTHPTTPHLQIIPDTTKPRPRLSVRPAQLAKRSSEPKNGVSWPRD